MNQINRILMTWCAVLAVMFQITGAGRLLAEDYLLQLDTFGYEDATEEMPRETLLRSIAVVVHPGSTFRTQSLHAEPSEQKTENSTFRGELRTGKVGNEEGQFALEFRYRHVVDRGVTVPTENGERSPVLGITSFATNLTLKMNEPVTIGCLEKVTSQQDGGERRSRIRGIVTLKQIVDRSE